MFDFNPRRGINLILLTSNPSEHDIAPEEKVSASLRISKANVPGCVPLLKRQIARIPSRTNSMHLIGPS